MGHVLDQIARWAGKQSDIRALCVVGSHANGLAKPDSDLDLVILCVEPRVFLDDQNWLRAFGEIEKSELEDWGALKSIRAFYRGGSEVEFGIASLGWAA